VSGDLETRVEERFGRFGLAASNSQIEQLATYFGLLAKWNKTVNLTAFSLEHPSDKALDRLLVEPFLAARFVARKGTDENDWNDENDENERERTGTTGSPDTDSPGPASLLDVGSGGGSPAIPLAIALPAFRLTMVESRARKSAFLREAARQVGLEGAKVLNTRLETLVATAWMEQSADLISVRALRADPALWAVLSEFAKPGARVMWFRTGTGAAPVALAAGLQLEGVEPLIPADASELAILRKLFHVEQA